MRTYPLSFVHQKYFFSHLLSSRAAKRKYRERGDAFERNTVQWHFLYVDIFVKSFGITTVTKYYIMSHLTITTLLPFNSLIRPLKFS